MFLGLLSWVSRWLQVLTIPALAESVNSASDTSFLEIICDQAEARAFRSDAVKALVNFK